MDDRELIAAILTAGMLPTLEIPRSRAHGSGRPVTETEGEDIQHAVDATRVARCALHILQSVERWKDRCQRPGEAKIRIAVGIHYGEVVQGDIGSDKLLELTVVGDTVNIASRVESYCPRLDAGCSSLAYLSIFCARKAAKNSQPDSPTKGITSSPVALSQSTPTT